MTPPFIPPPIPESPTEQPLPDASRSEPIPDTSSPPPADDTRGLSPPGGSSQPPALTVQTAVGPSTSPSSSPISQQTVDPLSGSSGSDESSGNSSSLEIVTHCNATDGWEADTQRGVPLDVRVHSELHRLRIAESTTNLDLTTHSSRLGPSDVISSSNSYQCSHCSTPEPVNTPKRQLHPQSSPEVTEDEPDNWSPPSSPKSKRGWKKLFAPIVTHDTKTSSESPLSPLPKSPTGTAFTLLQSAWASTVTLASTTGSPSKSTNSSPSSATSTKRRDTSGVRRIFAPKGKERELSPTEESEEEPWEVVSRTSVILEEQMATKAGSKFLSPIRDLRRDWKSAPPSTTGSRPLERPRPSGSPSATTPFLNRPVRHPVQSGGTLTLPFNQSVVSVAHSAAGASALNSPISDTYASKKVKRPPPPPPPPRRKAVSTSVKPNASVIHLPLLDTEGTVSPLEQRQVSSPVHSTTNIVCSPSVPRPSPSLPALRPGSRDGIEQQHTPPNSAPISRLPSPFAASTATLVHRPDPTSISSGPTSVPAVPLIRYPPPTSRITAPPAITVVDSVSTISISLDSPPSSPTTPTRHYPGRPLPQPPQHPSPLRRAAMGAPLPPVGFETPSTPEYSHLTDLDLLDSRVIEGDHDGRHYDVSLAPPVSPSSERLSLTAKNYTGPPPCLRVRRTGKLARPVPARRGHPKDTSGQPRASAATPDDAGRTSEAQADPHGLPGG